MSVAGNEKKINEDANANNIIFTIKNTKFHVPVVTRGNQQETIKNYQNFLGKDLKDQFIGINIKQKVRIKIQQMNLDIFSN